MHDAAHISAQGWGKPAATSCAQGHSHRRRSNATRRPAILSALMVSSSTAFESLDDERLLAQVAAGDHGAFEAMYDRFSGIAYSVAMAVLRDVGAAEDATQECFVRVWRSADSFDEGKSSAKTWITTIAHRCSLDSLRRRSARAPQVSDGEVALHTVADAADTEAHALETVASASLTAILLRIPAVERAVIDLAYMGGFSHSEIAARLDIPVGTVKTRLYHGTRRLRALMSPEEVGVS